MSNNRYHAREAAAALIKMAQATADPTLAARLIDCAADLKDQVGELPPSADSQPPALGKEA